MRTLRYLALLPLAIAAALLLAFTRPPQPAHYLVVWAMQAQYPQAKFRLAPGGTAPWAPGRDFLAVYDAAPHSPTWGRPLATLSVGPAAFIHHTNYQIPPNHILYANDWLANHTYVFDLRNLLHPRLLRQFRSVGAYGWPHSFQYLPSGNTLVTFQFSGGFNHAPGGLVEFAPGGQVLRTASAAVAAFPDIRPYSLAVVPALDRVVTGSSPMASGSKHSHVVQIWRLSDLRLLKTLVLPGGATNAFEPRVLADGRTIVVPSEDCNLFLVRGLGGADPSLQHIYHFGLAGCGVPAVAGNFYLQPSGKDHAVVSLDLTRPEHPREAGRVTLPAGDLPHWVTVQPGGTRVAMTGFGGMITKILFASLDRRTGALRLDSHVIDMGRAIPHAVLFTPR